MLERIKYPRTLHCPWSDGINSDDKIHKDMSLFFNKEIVVTEKMDGENTTCYFDGYTHARSIDSKYHESRNWLKNFWNERCWSLPKYYRICGENLYAQHSILYNNLESYFYGFSLWKDDICFS